MPALKPDRVAVCYGKLTADEAACQRYWPVLDSTEQHRAGQFANATLKYRYVEAHGILRHWLSRYVNQTPERITIQTGEHGKPYLPDFPDWAFNLSHSDHHFALAIAQACRLGIDIETIKPRNSMAQLVRKCFATEEATYWHNLDAAEQTVAFYRIWTAKEAFAKATGRGITIGLDRCVTEPAQPSRLASIPPEYGSADIWRLMPLKLPDNADFCGTLALDKAVSGIDYHSPDRL